MKKSILFIISYFLIHNYILGQTVIIQNQNYQISQPVILVEKNASKPLYVTAFNNFEISEPYTLYGFLKVYPCDLGEFSEYPQSLIDNINKNRSYGINTWRLPTEDEMRLLIENATRIGLRQVYTRKDLNGISKDYMYWFKTKDGNYVGAYSYYTTYHCFNTSRIIRLVSDISSPQSNSTYSYDNHQQKDITLYREFNSDIESGSWWNSIYYSIVLYKDGTWKEIKHDKRKGKSLLADGTYRIKVDGAGYMLYLTQKAIGGMTFTYKQIPLSGITGDLIITIGDRRYISYQKYGPETSLW